MSPTLTHIGSFSHKNNKKESSFRGGRSSDNDLGISTYLASESSRIYTLRFHLSDPASVGISSAFPTTFSKDPMRTYRRTTYTHLFRIWRVRRRRSPVAPPRTPASFRNIVIVNVETTAPEARSVDPDRVPLTDRAPEFRTFKFKFADGLPAPVRGPRRRHCAHPRSR